MGRFTEVLNESFRSGATPTTPNTGAINTVGSMAITNASIAVDISVADYVSVTQSGAYLTILGSVNVNNNTAGSVVYIPAGSVIITNSIIGSFAQTNNSLWTGVGSVLTQQGTNPWIVLGSTQVTNPPYLGSTFTVSGVQEVSQTNEYVPANKQYVTLVAGSPTASVSVFSQVVKHVNLSTMEGSMIVMLDGTAGLNSGLYFPAYSRDTINGNCGSVSAYGVNGSLFALGTW